MSITDNRVITSYIVGNQLLGIGTLSAPVPRGYAMRYDLCVFVLLSGDPGESLPVSCEEDIFDYIDYKYKKPEDRNL